jgi:ethanolamine transporter EutH
MFTSGLASLTNDPAKMGTKFGMVCSVVGFATLAGPPTAGSLIERIDGSYLGAQIWAGIFTLVGGIFMALSLCADRKARPKKGTQPDLQTQSRKESQT